jgi:hypothetical protein
MMFDPVASQTFEAAPAGGRFDSSLVIAPPSSKVQAAAKKLGLPLKVETKPDGSVSMWATDLTWETELETPFGRMTVRDAMSHPVFQATGKLRCQAPFRASDSEAAFLSLGKNDRPFIHDSGTSTTHWLLDADWQPNTAVHPMSEASAIEPLFDVDAYRAGRFIGVPPPEQTWILDDFLPAGIVGIVVAPGGTGKSWLNLQLAASVVTGLPLVGEWQVGLTGSVLMLSAEDDEGQLHRRMDQLLQQLLPNASPEMVAALRQKLIIVPRVGEDNLLTSTDPDSREVGMTVLLDRLIAAARQINDLALIIIDPASRFRGGDENAAEDTTRFVQALERITKELGATVLVTHHSNKGAFSASEQNQSASRGSSALTDGVRWQLNLMTFGEREAKNYGISSEERGLYLTAALTKSNYSAPRPPVILQRGAGGYLHRAKLVSNKDVQASDLKSRIVALVASEAKDGRRYSKTGFANQFGRKDGSLGAGNNTVRDILGELIAAGLVRVEGGKLTCATKAKAPKVLGGTAK